jgi:hypothetical protein
MLSRPPFTLSLSKGLLFHRQGFDKLNPNGSGTLQGFGNWQLRYKNSSCSRTYYLG